MVYSVYNSATGKYDYFERSPRAEDSLYPEPKHLRGGALGMSSEAAGYRLPAGCRLVGSGDSPKGMVATRNPSFSPFGAFDLGGPKLILLLVGGFVAYRYLEKK